MVETPHKLQLQKSYSCKAYLGRYPYNLINSENLEKYYTTLTDFNFITVKINHSEFGVQPLIEDYDLIDDTDTLNYPEYNSEKVKSLKLIQGALKLSAHILAVDKGQLASQLHGRLLNQKMAKEIQALLAKIKQSTTIPWLRPLTPSLTPPGGRLLRTLKGHSYSVKAVAVTPNGQQVISASDDNTLKVWNLATGEEQFTLNGHSNSVKAVAVTPKRQQVISASDDNTPRTWSPATTGEEQFTLNGHSSWVKAVAVTPNGQQVISASDDNTLKVWNLATGE
ncbi:WD40 repeat domain-containing protein, partial [Nostoc sp.]|uniref:WD40 repeat domain-containing protein n=1 Tax=Nostoc sp. TaxID=1180 RepID=UPI003B6165BA